MSEHSQKSIESLFEKILFGTRWFAIPVYVGMALVLLLLSARCTLDIIEEIPKLLDCNMIELLAFSTEMTEVVMATNLIKIVLFGGYENFVSRMDIQNNRDYPSWLLHISFSDIKVKVMATLNIQIAVNVLKSYINHENQTEIQIGLMIFLSFTCATGVLTYVNILEKRCKKDRKKELENNKLEAH